MQGCRGVEGDDGETPVGGVAACRAATAVGSLQLAAAVVSRFQLASASRTMGRLSLTGSM